MKSNSSEKYNIILSILLFLIPIICLNISYYFISIIKIDWAKKEQEKNALLEAETLASESNFANLFASNFFKIFDLFKKDADSGVINTDIFAKKFNNNVDNILSKPFPQKYSLYLFKIASGTQRTELLFLRGENKTGNRALCKAIEQLYYVNTDYEQKDEAITKNSTFLKNILGEFTDINIIAKEMRGLPTQTNGIHSYSWFIWDYIVDDSGIYAGIFICDQTEDWELAGYKNALKELKKRGKAIGGFLPLYKDYGEPILDYPLDKSRSFARWAQTITIQEEEKLNHWLINSLPQGVKLGNYTAFTYLDRGAAYIAVVLVKNVKGFFLPKWLISLDIFLILLLSLVIYSGIVLGKWPNMSLKTRFTLSYTLASILPISFLSVATYGYVMQYQKNSENQTFTNIETTIKSFEVQKLTRLKTYREKKNKKYV